MSWIHKAMIAAIIAGLILLLPLLQSAVWDGSFPLTVTIQAAPSIDTNHLLFEPCSSQGVADIAMEVGSEGEGLFKDGPFNSTEQLYANTYLVRVPCSGRSGLFDIEYSYVEPKYLVVEYKTDDSESAPSIRKQFSIPAGRGSRSITITLP